MKRKIFCLLSALLLLLGLALPAWAAEQIPIIAKDSSLGEIAYGLNLDGSVYVPLRSLFELTQAEVDWRPADRLITIKRVDGAVLTMRPGDKQAKINHLGEARLLEMPAAARLLNGTTYVPIRFAAENLLCAVEWDGAAKEVLLQKRFVTAPYEPTHKRYTLDLGAGKLYELNAAGEARLLGQPQDAATVLLDDYDPGWECLSAEIENVWETPEGCVALKWRFSFRDSQVWTRWHLLLTPDGQNNRSTIFKGFYTEGEEFLLCADDANIWWPEEERVLQLDNKTGAVVASYDYAQLLAALPQAHNFAFSFCDGEYMLLSYQQEEHLWADLPVLVDLKTGEVTDLFTELIPAEERAGFRDDLTGGSSALLFTKAADGVLYFDYIKFVPPTWQREHNEITYRYK